MTDSSDTADDHPTAATSDSDYHPIRSAETTTARDGSVWQKLNRTNRILTVVLGASVAAVIVALVFGAGVFVGAEDGDHDEHGGGVGSSERSGEYGDGAHEQRGEGPESTQRDEHDGAGERADADRAASRDQPVHPEVPGGSNTKSSPAPGPSR